MTSHEVYAALFWIVAGGYVAYLGWTLYRIAAERTARSRHPSSLPQLAGGDAEVRGRGGSSGLSAARASSSSSTAASVSPRSARSTNRW